MTLFSIGIRDDGEVLTVTKAPHQADDCDGLIYRARDEEGHDVFLFFISAVSQGDAVMYARETFGGGEYVALDPMWQPGSIWPDTADASTPEQAFVQIYSTEMGRGYITTVPTHGRVNPFIDHFGERIMWAYMRMVEQKCCEELERTNERWRRYWKEHQTPQPQLEQQEPVGEQAGTVAQPQQLFIDFG